MAIVTSPFVAGFLATTLVFLALHIRSSRRRARLPPGPKPLPLIGNLRDLPRSEEWLTFQSYVERYGDLVFLSALGTNYLILGSQEAINDVIEKRGHVNGRPRFTMLHELMDIEWLLASMPYGEYWRQSRKIIHTHVNAGAAIAYEPIQMQGARQFVRDLLAAERHFGDGDRFSDSAKSILPDQIRLSLGRMGVRMTYGIDIRDEAAKEKYIDNPEALVRAFSVAATPGRFLVDYFPTLKYIPSWVPGAGFQLYAKNTAMLSKQIRDEPMSVVKAQMAAGTASISLAAQLLEGTSADGEQLIKDSVASMLLGAGDTSSGAIAGFFLAMVAFPGVQKQAQEELDRVVGRHRLPEFSDKNDLVYIDAMIRETLRWLPIAPCGLPHMTEQDDEYRGYFIPKGTLTIPLQWNILRDSQIYSKPEIFSPERYLTRHADGTWVIREDVLDPRKIAFGFGRRACPGTHIAERTLFAAITTVLHTTDIMRAKDSEGKDVMPDIGMNSGIVCHPRLFAYELKMRNDARDLIDTGDIAGV